MSNDAAGFLLLTVPDCRIDTGGQVYNGQLALECVTIAQGSNNDIGERDIWLVLRIGALELAIPPVQPILHDRAHGVYTIPGQPNAVLRMPLASPDSSLKEDLDTFEVLLAQYGVVHEQGGGPPAGFGEKGNEDFRGRLVLVDEADGQIVGEVGEQYAVRADVAFNRPGHEKDPVIVDMPAPGQLQEIQIHSIRPEEQDALLRGAHTLSRGIIMATNLVSTGMSSASSLFVNNTKPNDTPVEFSERTRTNVKRVHKVSGTAVKVTAATTAAIFKTIDHVARYVAGPSRPASPVPPPIPPRAATYAPSGTPTPAPPYQPYQTGKSATLAPLDTRAPPPLPSRKGTTSSQAPGGGYLSPAPMSPPYSLAPTPPPTGPTKKPRLLNRLLMATDILITTVEESGKHLLSVGTTSLSHGMGHRYGKEMGEAVQLGGETARNVAMVYIDARGVGHRALLRRAGKGMLKARFGSGGNKEVVFVGDAPPLPPR